MLTIKTLPYLFCLKHHPNGIKAAVWMSCFRFSSFGHKIAIKFIEIDMNAPVIVYYMVSYLKILYEYSTTLIWPETPSKWINAAV